MIMPSMWPPTRSTAAGAAPLYGTCCTFTLASVLKSSMARCGNPPLPAEAKLSFPGRAFASATSSFSERTGSVGMHRDQLRRHRYRGDSREVPQRVVGDLRVGMRADRERTGARERQGVAVGGGTGDELGGDRRVRARSILDHDLRRERLGEPGGELPRHDVVRAARRKADDEADRFRGIVLGACNGTERARPPANRPRY